MVRKAVPESGYKKRDVADKNRDVVKAIVFGGDQPVEKAAEGVISQQSTDEFQGLYSDAGIVAPPLDLLTLSMMEENSSELRQCIDAMEVNIEGFGGRLVLREMSDDEAKTNAKEIEKEKKELRRFLLTINPELDITALRRRARRDLEKTGMGYWELVPTRKDRTKVACVNLVPSHTMRITKQDDESTQVEKNVVDPETGEIFTQIYRIKFRRFVQLRNRKKVYFKHWLDPRIVDCRDGKAYADEKAAKAEAIDEKYWATSVLPFEIPTERSPYGLPRYIGNLFSIFGSRAAEEINYNTFLNNNVPSMILAVSGNAMLTEGTIRRIEEYQASISKRTANMSKFLILEAEPATDANVNSGTAKIDITPLKGNQHDDQLFQNYDENNLDKIRRCFRLPPIFVGRSNDYNRGTAEASRKLAEEQIFAPEREEMDKRITELFVSMGYRFWVYKSFSPNVTNDQDLTNILNQTEKTGALTPNFARQIIGDVMNRELRPYKKDEVPFDPDIPFSWTIAQAVKGVGALGGNEASGVLAPNQGQMPKPEPHVPGSTEVEPTIKQNGENVMTNQGYDNLLDVHHQLDKFLNQNVHWKESNGSGESIAF